MWLSTLPRRFGIILEKILDRHERSGIAVQWNVCVGGGGGGLTGVKIRSFYSAVTSAGKTQNMKPVQKCTGFIFCTFHTVVGFLMESVVFLFSSLCSQRFCFI